MNYYPFEIKSCPQECGQICGTNLEKCPLYQKLPEDFQKECRENLHLLQYLYMLPLDTMEIPKYYEKITLKMLGMKDPNLIYKANSGVFIHIMPNSEDIRDYYIAIEPSIIETQESILEQTEMHLAEHVEELTDVLESANRLNVIMSIIDNIVYVSDVKTAVAVKNTGKDKNNGNGHKNAAVKVKDKKNGDKPQTVKRSTQGRMPVTQFQYNSLRYLLKRKLEGMGILDPMIHDPYIEDISCSGLGNIFVEHKIFGGTGLDVFEGEELVKDENQMLTKNVSVDRLEPILKRNILLKREDVIITPHMAFDSTEAVERILDTTAENIKGFLEGKNYHKVI